jgi:hypothetical protein
MTLEELEKPHLINCPMSKKEAKELSKEKIQEIGEKILENNDELLYNILVEHYYDILYSAKKTKKMLTDSDLYFYLMDSIVSVIQSPEVWLKQKTLDVMIRMTLYSNINRFYQTLNLLKNAGRIYTFTFSDLKREEEKYEGNYL